MMRDLSAPTKTASDSYEVRKRSSLPSLRSGLENTCLKIDVLKGTMESNATIAPEKKKSVHALEATNFFLADVQTGLGPFLAAYLAGAGWQPGRVGMALTIGGIITVVLQAPAGAIVDQLRSKRLILVIASAVLALGAVLLSVTAAPWAVYTSQVLIGGAGPFLGPTLAAVTMGIVGVTCFDRQFGKNQSFNSAGNVVCALLIAGVSHCSGIAPSSSLRRC